MMKKQITAIFITDHKISLFHDEHKNKKPPRFGSIELDEGTLKDGRIMDPYGLKASFQKLFKSTKVHPKKVKLIIHDSSVLIRQLVIQKSALKGDSFDDYLENAIGTAIKHPFHRAAFSYTIIKETEESYTMLIILADEVVLHHYHDVLNSLSIFDIQMEMTMVTLYAYCLSQKDHQPQHLMQVVVFDREFTISIIEKGIPVFLMTEELENHAIDRVLVFMERILNYFRYNMNKGEKTVTETVIFNFSAHIDDRTIERDVMSELTEFNATLMKWPDDLPTSNGQLNDIRLPYASLKGKSHADIAPIKLNRLSTRLRLASFFFVMAFTVFSITVLIYIPFHLASEKLTEQQQINQTLEAYYLRMNRIENQDEDALIERYREAYDFLDVQTVTQLDKWLNQLVSFTSDVRLETIHVNQRTHTITILIQAESQHKLEEYVLMVYETHGIINGQVTEERWIAQPPSFIMKSTFVMEVRIVYAK